MDMAQAVVLGLVQGLGEFLPISSSAHLVLAPWFMKWADPGLTFDIALHVGTLIAVVLYFWKDWFKLLSKGLTRPKEREGKLFWYLVLATIRRSHRIYAGKYCRDAFPPSCSDCLHVVSS